MRSLPKFAMFCALIWSQVAHSQIPSAPSKTLQVIASTQFCSHLNNILASYAISQGRERRESLRLANKVSDALIRRMRAGTSDAFLNVSSLVGSTAADAGDVWLNTSDLVVSALGFAPERVLVVEKASDFKFTTHVMPGSQLLFMASDTADLNSDRIKLISNTANGLGIKIHVVRIIPAQKPGRISSELVSLAATTGGTFVDLSAPNACGAY